MRRRLPSSTADLLDVVLVGLAVPALIDEVFFDRDGCEVDWSFEVRDVVAIRRQYPVVAGIAPRLALRDAGRSEVDDVLLVSGLHDCDELRTKRALRSDVEAALLRLLEPADRALTYIETHEWEVAEGEPPVEFTKTERITLNADQTIAVVFVDHTEEAEVWAALLDGAVEAEASSDAEDTMLPAVMGIAAQASVPMTYVVELDETGQSGLLWYRFGDAVDADIAQLRQLMPYSDGDPEMAAYFANQIDGASSLEGLDDWASVPWSTDSRYLFPAGRGPAAATLSFPIAVESVIAAGPLNEVGRTEFVATFSNGAWSVDMDGDGSVIAMESVEAGRRIEIGHDVDPSVFALVDDSQLLTLENYAAWIGVDPSCIEGRTFAPSRDGRWGSDCFPEDGSFGEPFESVEAEIVED